MGLESMNHTIIFMAYIHYMQWQHQQIFQTKEAMLQDQVHRIGKQVLQPTVTLYMQV